MQRRWQWGLQYVHAGVCLLLQLMQDEVEHLQEKVNGLHSMVVVVDENNAESGNVLSAIALVWRNSIHFLWRCARKTIFTF